MRKLVIIAALCFYTKAKAQLYLEPSSYLTLADKALLHVDTDVVNGSEISNKGTISLTGNWENRDKNGGFLHAEGLVILAGKDQVLTGTYPLLFSRLLSVGAGVKQSQQDIKVLNELNLGDNEFFIGANKLYLLSSKQDALNFSRGFISTSYSGYFYRTVEKGRTYHFPMGVQQKDRIFYRPVELKATKDKGDAGVSLVYQDPNSLFYNRNNKKDNVVNINPVYFHVFDGEVGASPVEMSLFYNSSEDRDFNGLAYWLKDSYNWEKASNAIISPNSSYAGLDKIITYTASELKELPVALADVGMIHDLIFYNSFTPDGDGVNDTWSIGGIDKYPDNEIVIFNRWGGEVFRVKSFSSASSWDGSKLNDGTYYYLLKVKINNQYQSFKGFISLQKGQQ